MADELKVGDVVRCPGFSRHHRPKRPPVNMWGIVTSFSRDDATVYVRLEGYDHDLGYLRSSVVKATDKRGAAMFLARMALGVSDEGG